MVASAARLRDVLNGPEKFAEFESADGKPSFIAKQQIASISPLNLPRTDQLQRKARDAGSFDAYETLGIQRSAGPGEIRAAYWSKARLYHPDKVAGLGAPKEVMEYMSAQFMRIHTAYEQLSGDTSGGAPPA